MSKDPIENKLKELKNKLKIVISNIEKLAMEVEKDLEDPVDAKHEMRDYARLEAYEKSLAYLRCLFESILKEDE